MPSFYEVIMIKECDVILHNDKVAVVVFEGKKIQVPNSDLINRTAYIKYEDGKYIVVSKDEASKSYKKKPKKETVKVEVEPVVTVEEADNVIEKNSELLYRE